MPTASQSLVFPYGIANFEAIRREGMLYVDRTAAIRDLERLGRNVVFLRPRRFGKSLWLRTLVSYYDVRRAEDFELLFGNLDIGREPTPLRHRYFILNWNFSTVAPGRTLGKVEENLAEHVRSRAEGFVSDYRDHLPTAVNTRGNPAAVLNSILSAVRRTPYELYLVIDEYDNFINEIMVTNRELYHSLVETGGPFKQLFKSVKEAAEGQGLGRVFVTGVSPVALNDITSGFNNAEDLTHDPALATLCGFHESEIRRILERIADERGLSGAEIERHLEMMRIWYNGYRFNDEVEELVYNPTNALYFFKRLARTGKPPRDLHDQNLRTDRGKIAFIARSNMGSGLVENLAEGDGTVALAKLKTAFSLQDLAEGIHEVPDTLASFLYYLGILTHTRDDPRRLRVPNLVIRQLFLEHFLELYLPESTPSSEARKLAYEFLDTGDPQRLLLFFEHRLLPVLSNRDRGTAPKEPWQSGGGVNEMVLKTLFLAVLFDDERYSVFSELEVERGYADLCLLARPDRRTPKSFDFLLEFKLVRREDLGKKVGRLRQMDDEELRGLLAVEKAVGAARDQLKRYREALLARFGEALNLRSFAVVAVDLERLVVEKV